MEIDSILQTPPPPFSLPIQDLESTPKTISFAKNGTHFGTAFELDSSLKDRPLYPHVATKNVQISVNFGQPVWCETPDSEGYAPLQDAAEEHRVLNTSKVKVMVISRKRSPPRPVIQIQGDTVEHVSSFKLLGVVITSDLTWKIHIQHIICKARKLLGFLHRVFAEGGRRCLVQLYESIILPHLDYCSPIWDPHQKTHI